jgi:hypothetical protein
MNVKSTVFGVFGSLKLLTDGLRILGSYSSRCSNLAIPPRQRAPQSRHARREDPRRL